MASRDEAWLHLRSAHGGIFDIICENVAHVLKVSLCEINVVGEREQYHLGKFPATGSRSDPIEDSICRFVVERNGVVSLPDCRLDESFKDVRAVKEGFCKSYLGIPLYFRGLLLGSLCVGNDEPRQWTEKDVDVLRRYATNSGVLTTKGHHGGS